MVLKSRTKKKTNETAKRNMLNSLLENDNTEEQKLNKQLTMPLPGCHPYVHHDEDIIKTQNKKAIRYNGNQRQLF